MTARSVIHDTFTIERSYPVAPSRVFAAFASAEAKSAWGDTGNLEPADGQAAMTEFDFRPGGRERFGIKMTGTTFRYDGPLLRRRAGPADHLRLRDVRRRRADLGISRHH